MAASAYGCIYGRAYTRSATQGCLFQADFFNFVAQQDMRVFHCMCQAKSLFALGFLALFFRTNFCVTNQAWLRLRSEWSTAW